METVSISNFGWVQNLADYFTSRVTQQHIKGKLLHPNGEPIASQKIVLLSPGWFQDAKIADAVTDHEGTFSVKYNLEHSVNQKSHQAVIQVFEKTISSETEIKERNTNSIPVSIPIQPYFQEIGNFQIKLYESQKNFPTLYIDDFANRPHQSTTAFYREVFSVLARETAETIAAYAIKLFSKERALEILTENRDPVLLNSENTIDFMLNGLFQAQFLKGNNENELVSFINWKKYDKKTVPDLPNVSITLKKTDDKLSVKDVSIEFAKETSKKFSPETLGFEKIGLYNFNSMGFIKGEAEAHLGRAHLMTEQIALSFFRHIRNHPIRKLLEPHLEGIFEIDRLGDGLIFGESGILTLSALTQKGVSQLMEDSLNFFDFNTFQPRKPLSPDHRFAYAQQLFWDIVTEVVDQFFVENAAEISSSVNWYEVYNMSETLVKQSLPYRPYGGEGLDNQWFDRSEIDQPEIPGRVERDGHLRAIRPMVSSKKAADEASLNNLKQLCRFVLLNATFYHWAVHTSQAKWGTNPEFASLAPERGNIHDLREALQVDGVNTLTGFRAPTIVENRFGTIYPLFIEKLLAYKEVFAKWGYDVTQIHSAIWI